MSWQAKAGVGYDIAAFRIDWARQTVTCPQGQTSADWEIHVGFPDAVCRQCRARSLCTRAKTAPRELTFRRAGYHEAVQERRQGQTTPEWRALYSVRAGVEGCLSQAVRLCGLRRSRYIGIAKTRLQHGATAAAINLIRLDAWLRGTPFAKTRVSHFAALKLAAA